MTRHHSFTTIAVLCLCAACGSRSDESLVTVRDSAGIEIVESHGPQWVEGEGWTLSREPILEIGVSEGEDPYLLDQVRGIVRFGDGSVVIANSGDNTLRYYDESGTFLHSAGGSGGGPAEFEGIMGLGRLGDEILALQWGVSPSKVFDRQGNLVRALEAPTWPIAAVGVFEDGAQLFGRFMPARAPETPLQLDSTVLYLSTPDFAESDSIARLPAAYTVAIDLPTRRISYPQEYGPVRAVAAGEDEWYYGWPETYEFQVLDREASVHRVVRRAWEPVPVTDADRERHRESMLNLGTEGGGAPPPRLVAQRRAIVDGMIYPEHHPAFQRIYPDPSGHVWVWLVDPAHPYPPRDAPSTWDVFDPSGAWLGSVEFPERFTVYEIGESHVAGVWRDEMDVERVRVYGVSREP